MKKEYTMPVASVREMKHRLSMLAGSDSLPSGGDGQTGDHGEAKSNGIFDMDLAGDEE